MFGLYSRSGSTYSLVRNVKIAGVLGNHIATTAGSLRLARSDQMPWTLSGQELCRAVIEENQVVKPARPCSVLIDATFGRADATLLEIDRVWGLSSHNWTPLLLRMRVLRTGLKRRDGKSTPVARFRLRSGRPATAHEFLYLQCGHAGGTRNWGRMGYTNAVLLWPDALAHLLRQIGFERKLPGRIQGNLPELTGA